VPVLVPVPVPVSVPVPGHSELERAFLIGLFVRGMVAGGRGRLEAGGRERLPVVSI
jgi:hypothetical protein